MKIILTETVTDLKWSDCTDSYPQPMHHTIPAVSYQVSQNNWSRNAMQMNQQSYYAQDSVPQHTQSYIHSQLSHYRSVPESASYYRKEPNHKHQQHKELFQQSFLKTIYFDKLSVSKSVNTHSKSQSLKPNMHHNPQLTKIEYLICGYCRKTFIPNDIINLFIKYHGQKSNSTIIIRPYADGFNSIDYKTLNTIRYAPSYDKYPRKHKLIMNCIGHNVSLPDHIIQSYNISPIAEFTTMINVSVWDEFNVVFFETKLTGRQSTPRLKDAMYHAVIFNESIAVELTLPSYPFIFDVSCNLVYLYSSKYGFLLLNRNNIQCFSLKHWKWSILVTNVRSTGLEISARNSSFQMISEHKFLMMFVGNRGKSFIIFDLRSLKVTYRCGTFRAHIGRRRNEHKPVICYDDTLYKRLYFCGTSGGVWARCEYYDMRTCEWNDLGNCFKHMSVHGFDSIWLDDEDKNLLYAAESARICVLDLRTKRYREILKFTL